MKIGVGINSLSNVTKKIKNKKENNTMTKKTTKVTTLRNLLTMLFSLTLIWCFSLAAQAQEGVAINSDNFPDSILLQEAHFADDNQDGYLTPDETARITELDYGLRGITSLEGVQYFPNLERLIAYRNQDLVHVDLRENLKLKEVSLHTSPLKTLLLPYTPTLRKVDICNTKVESLDITMCPGLTFLNASFSSLKKIDIKFNHDLEILNLQGTKIQTIDTSNNKLLKTLSVGECQLTNVQVEHLPNLINFYGEKNIREFYDTTIDTRSLPGFNMSRVGSWSNATVNGTLVSFKDTAKPIRYTYTVGGSQVPCIFEWRYQKSDGNKLTQTISVDKKFYANIGEFFPINATTDGDGILSYDWNSNIIDIDPTGLVTVSGAGIVDVTITASSTATYEKATETVTIFISNRDVNISGLHNAYVVKLGNPPVQFHPTTNSDSPMTFRTTDESVIQVDDTCKVSFVGIGTADLIIKTRKTANFHAFEMRVKFTVQSEYLNAAILTSQDNYPVMLGDKSFNLNAWTTGSEPIYYRSEQPHIASVDNEGNITINSVGVATIVLSSPKTDYFDELETRVTITVSGPPQEAVLNVNDRFSATYGDKSFNLGASSNDGKISYRSNNNNVVTVDANGIVTIKGAGTTTITVSTANISKNVTINVAKKQAALTVTNTNYVVNLGDRPFNIKATSSNKLAYKSSNNSVVTVDANGNVTIKGAGTATITVSTVSDNNYLPVSKTVSITVKNTVTQKVGSITGVKSSYTFTYGQKPYTLKTKGTGTLSYTIKDRKVATISSSGRISVKGPGKTVLTITVAANGNYTKVVKNITITVKPRTMAKLKLSTSSKKIKVSWKKDSKVNGYEIWYATNSKFSKKRKVITLKKSSYTSKTLKTTKRTTYYVKVRSYKLVGKTKVYSSFSKTAKLRSK